MAEEAPTANGDDSLTAVKVAQEEIDSNALHDEMVMKQQEAIDKEVADNYNYS